MPENKSSETSGFPIEDRPEEFLVKTFENDQPDDHQAFEEAAEGEPRQESAMEHGVSNWRAAKSLLRLKDQVNAAFPNRKKASDGMIGDQSHCGGGGSSDHCPNIPDGGFGVVTAYDVTHDPGSGCDMNAVVKAIWESRDPRVKYIIWNRKIANSKAIGSAAPWQWRDYGGSNPHTKHMHLSVLSNKQKYDDPSDWTISSPGLTS